VTTLALTPANTHPPSSNFGATSGIWRSGDSAESRHQKISGNICGGLPTRRYGAGKSFAVLLKIRAPEFAGHSSAPESGAKDTRSPDASRLLDVLKLRNASGLLRVHRRF
jgi:hypothetical protein